MKTRQQIFGFIQKQKTAFISSVDETESFLVEDLK